eukprot:1151915-Pelagomonas_calceolata.AAC.2
MPKYLELRVAIHAGLARKHMRVATAEECVEVLGCAPGECVFVSVCTYLLFSYAWLCMGKLYLEGGGVLSCAQGCHPGRAATILPHCLGVRSCYPATLDVLLLLCSIASLDCLNVQLPPWQLLSWACCCLIVREIKPHRYTHL